MRVLACRTPILVLGSVILITSPLVPSRSRTQEPRLCPELEILSPFLGDWIGEFQNAGERPQVRRSWTPILDGQAIRERRTIPELDFEAESIFYYDHTTDAVLYLGLTNNGYVGRGRIGFEDGAFVQTGDQIQPDGTTSAIRVHFLFEDGPKITNRLFSLVDGEWHPGHTIVYTPTGSR